MSNFTITIVGAGVIGTSMGLAIKQEKDAPRLVAHDKELSNARAAVKKGAFDKAEWNLINACEQADLIILAIPFDGIRPTLEAIASDLKEGVVISDTATTKAPLLAWADELLPETVHFVGGNPIVHTAGSGYDHASADLFRQKLYCLTPAPSANEEAVQLMVGLANLLGAKPYFLDATEHDGLVTAVEHLPTLISAALVNTLSNEGSWREIRKLAGGLFEQVSSGATGDPDGIKEALLAGHDSLLHWLDAYIVQLYHLRTLLADQDSSEETLAELLDKAIVERQNWLTDYQGGRFVDPELISPDIKKPGLMRQLLGIGPK